MPSRPAAPTIHPSALVHHGAEIDDGVEVGPFCVVGEHVHLGARTRLLAHCVVSGPTTLGMDNVVHPFAVVGGDPQHRAFAGEPTRLCIGDRNVLREHVTVHRGTLQGSGVTRIGSDCLLMAGVHVAHDAVVEDHVTLTNGTLLGGHVEVGAWAVLAGHVAVAPFARVGESAFLAGNAMVERDVPPFVIAAGDRATLRAINRVGLRRREIPEESLLALKHAFRVLFRSRVILAEALIAAEHELGSNPWVSRLLAFLRAPSKLGVSPSRRAREGSV